jgi:Rod binding domain-containing protein
MMDGLTITAATGSAPEPPKPKTAPEAAKQFEALLLGQMLRSAHEPGEDPTSDTMWDVAAQRFAQVMADNGGLGLAKLIQQGLERKPSS